MWAPQKGEQEGPLWVVTCQVERGTEGKNTQIPNLDKLCENENTYFSNFAPNVAFQNGAFCRNSV